MYTYIYIYTYIHRHIPTYTHLSGGKTTFLRYDDDTWLQIQAQNMGSPIGSAVKNTSTKQEMQVWSLGWKDPLEEGNGNTFQYYCLGNPMYIGPGQRFNFATILPPPENIGMFPLLLSSYSVMSDVLQSHGLQASLSFAVSQSLCKLMSIESVMPSNHFLPYCLQPFPASGSFPKSQLFVLVAKVLELQLQHQSFQWIFRVDFL